MKEAKLTVPIVTVLSLLITVSTVYAFQGTFNKQRPNFDPEKREAMLQEMVAKREAMNQKMEAVNKAIENNDYQAWAKLMEGQKITEVINEGNFGRFVEMHSLMNQAKQIKEELGLNFGREGNGFFKGHRMGFKEQLNTQD